MKQKFPTITIAIILILSLTLYTHNRIQESENNTIKKLGEKFNKAIQNEEKSEEQMTLEELQEKSIKEKLERSFSEEEMNKLKQISSSTGTMEEKRKAYLAILTKEEYEILTAGSQADIN